MLVLTTAGCVLHAAGRGFFMDCKMYEGTVCTVNLGRGFGFVAASGQGDLFFHASDLIDLEFNEQLIERRVRFDITSTAKGPRARNVQAAI
jgi:cold shock CspA family protein